MFIMCYCLFVISVYNLSHFKNTNISSTESDMRKRVGRINPLWEKCARLELMTLAHREYAGRVVSATQTAQVHKVYSVATHLDVGLSLVRCPVLNRTVRFWGHMSGWKFQLEPDTDIEIYTYVYRSRHSIFGSRTELGNRSRVSVFSTCRPGNPIWIKIRLVRILVIRTKILNTVKYSILIIHSCPFRTRTWSAYMQNQTPDG